MRRPTLLLIATSAVACRSAAPAGDVGAPPQPEPVAAPATVVTPPAAAGYEPAGRWNLVLDIQGQSLSVVMELVRTPDGGYSGTLSSEMGTAPINKVAREGNKVSLVFAAPGGGDGSMLLNFDGDTVTGEWSVPGMGSKLSGTRP